MTHSPNKFMSGTERKIYLETISKLEKEVAESEHSFMKAVLALVVLLIFNLMCLIIYTL